jgi:hypothetical protein
MVTFTLQFVMFLRVKSKAWAANAKDVAHNIVRIAHLEIHMLRILGVR